MAPPVFLAQQCKHLHWTDEELLDACDPLSLALSRQVYGPAGQLAKVAPVGMAVGP